MLKRIAVMFVRRRRQTCDGDIVPCVAARACPAGWKRSAPGPPVPCWRFRPLVHSTRDVTTPMLRLTR